MLAVRCQQKFHHMSGVIIYRSLLTRLAALLYARSGGKAEQLWKDANGRVNVNFSLSVLRNFLHFVYGPLLVV